MAMFFGITEEEAEEIRRKFAEWVSRQQAEHFLGSETYDKLQAEYGRAPILAAGQPSRPGVNTARATPNGLGAAEDHSGWNQYYLYCGGTCVPSAD